MESSAIINKRRVSKLEKHVDEVVASQLVAGEEALEIHTDRRDMKSALKDYQDSFSHKRS